ncbi:MAG: glycosyltransferase [Nanoarchaeota archaeon]|nr:glycosyltransferase [Nanoarchaeota archaeon]
MEEAPFLEDVSLCAIVRDEMINPAGGIKDFVRSTMPYVEKGVIVDTGSVDGTRDVLENLTKDYPNLKVYDRLFDDFASSRNYSIEQVETRGVLVLDADERLTRPDFENLQKELKNEINAEAVSLFLRDYYESSNILSIRFVHNPRFFMRRKNISYKNLDNKSRELLYVGDEVATKFYEFNSLLLVADDVSVKHFHSSRESSKWKVKYFYNYLESVGDVAPSDVFCNSLWKKLNPQRVGFKGLPELND